MTSLLLSALLLLWVSVTSYGATYLKGGVNTNQANGDVFYWNDYQSYGYMDGHMMRVLHEDTTPNTVKNLKLLSTESITELNLDIRRFGVIVEPTDDGKNITVDLVGVKYPNDVNVTTAVSDNILTVKVDVSNSKGLMLSTVEGDIINTVRIGLPAGIIKNTTLEDKENSCIYVKNLDVPVTGKPLNGAARVQADSLSAPINMEAVNGMIAVQAKMVSSPVTMKVVNGSTTVNAETITGKTTINTKNGNVNLNARSVNDALLSAGNGKVVMSIGTITGHISAGVDNGRLEAELTKKPSDLKFILNAKGAFYNNINIPLGWYNGYTIGTGKPLLEPSVGSGTIDLDVDMECRLTQNTVHKINYRNLMVNATKQNYFRNINFKTNFA